MGSCVSSVHSYGSSKNDSPAIPPSPIKEKPANGDPPINAWSATTFKDLGSKEETFFDSQTWLDSDCDDDFLSVRGGNLECGVSVIDAEMLVLLLSFSLLVPIKLCVTVTNYADFTPSHGDTPVHHSIPAGTSSRGHTPVHQSIRSGNPLPNKTFMEDKTPGSIPEPLPTGKKMKLSELFRQSIREDPEDKQTPGNQNTANGKVEVKKTILDVLPAGNGTPYISGMNSVASSERTANGDSLMDKEKPMRSVQCCLPSLVSRNFSERKKKMSPAIAING
ncbi:hypothetical protein EZV62_020100 [Acer yangbiense]|uniref:Uncharacterized protein n=1 Tax=Acer yangbiense TaxID=1000413 RepID=A0A5C7HCX8_9ROSI|nr:hypothetical protein EZV62_020100 [Acer yangbiense]